MRVPILDIPSSMALLGTNATDGDCRDQLREQHQLSEEIAQAITNTQIGDQADETELDAELEGLEQEAMDERMLHTGTVPVADQLNRLPAAANGERKSPLYEIDLSPRKPSNLILNYSQRQIKGTRGRRRGSRTGEAACGDGHGINHVTLFYSIFPELSSFLTFLAHSIRYNH